MKQMKILKKFQLNNTNMLIIEEKPKYREKNER